MYLPKLYIGFNIVHIFSYSFLSANDWEVTVVTGGMAESSLRSPATLVVYGGNGKNEVTLEPAHGKGFKSASTETLRVCILHIVVSLVKNLVYSTLLCISL